MSFTLGQGPETLRVVLVSNADFVSALKRSDATSWDLATQIALEIRTRAQDGTTAYVTWTATLNGDTAQWNVDMLEVNNVIAARPSTVRLWYTLGELRLLWAQGDVEVV